MCFPERVFWESFVEKYRTKNCTSNADTHINFSTCVDNAFSRDNYAKIDNFTIIYMLILWTLKQLTDKAKYVMGTI